MRQLARPVLFLLCALILGSVGGAATAGPITLRFMLWGSHSGKEAPSQAEQAPVARYQPDHGQGFIFDRSANPPLLRFEDSPEVWILQSQPGPRGDTIYRNDIGQPMLRATKLGGLTLFTADDPEGAAAAFDGDASTLRQPSFMPPNVLFQRMIQSSARSSRAAQKLIQFATVDDATPETAALIADAALVASEAIVRVSRMTNGKTALAPLSKVMLVRGRKPDAQMAAGALTVTYAPNAGVGERPSSERIIQIIAAPAPWRRQLHEAAARTGH